MPYFVALMEIVDPQLDQELLQRHIAFLNSQIEAGTVFAKGPFLDHTGGLIIYKTDNEDAALLLAKQDPAIAEGSRKLTFKAWRASLPE